MRPRVEAVVPRRNKKKEGKRGAKNGYNEDEIVEG